MSDNEAQGEAQDDIESDEPVTVPIASIKVLDFIPAGGAGEYMEETWLVEVNGTKYWYAVWGTSNSSGAEWYDDQHELTAQPDIMVQTTSDATVYDITTRQLVRQPVESVDLGDIISDIVRDASERYFDLHHERVKPVIQGIKDEIFPFTKS